MTDDRSVPAENPVNELSKAARVLIQARMLPMDPLTNEQIDQVRRDYMRYTTEHGLFDSRVAKQLGYSPSVLSQWKAGKYVKGDVEAVARRVNDWMEQDARARRAAMPTDYVRTEIAEAMRNIAMTAQTTQSMAVIVVPSGCGKTMVLKILADKLGGRYVYCSELMTPKSFLMDLAKAVDLASYGRSSASLQSEIIDKLAGTNRPILLDEAHRLPAKMFSVIRTIHDNTGVAVIMAGTHEILEKVADSSNARGQLTSRCLRYNAIDHLHDAERFEPDGGKAAGGKRGKPLFTMAEIKALFASSEIRIDPDAFQFIWALACLPNYGCLRTVRRIVQLVRQQKPTEAVTREDLIWALTLLFGSTGNHMANVAERHTEQLRRKIA